MTTFSILVAAFAVVASGSAFIEFRGRSRGVVAAVLTILFGMIVIEAVEVFGGRMSKFDDGLVALAKQDYATAKADFEAALDEGCDHAIVLSRIGETEVQSGDLGSARITAEEIFVSKGNHDSDLQNQRLGNRLLAMIANRSGDKPLMVHYLEQAAKFGCVNSSKDLVALRAKK